MTVSRLDRTLDLRFHGDWGDANLHRVAGWISYEVITRTPPHSRTAIHSGVGGFDAVLAVARGDVEIGLATPTCYVPMAFEGAGPFAGAPVADLRGLAVIPQDDRVIVGVRKSMGIGSLREVAERRLPLRIAVSPDDGRSHFGYAAHRILEAHGITLDRLRSWGGDLIYGERPDICLSAMIRGEADAVIHEAIMSACWRELVRMGEIAFVSLDEDALDVLETMHLPRGDVPAGYYDGQTEAICGLEFSDFLVFARADLPDDVAHLIVASMIETRARFEKHFAHIPVKNSPVGYPIDPRAMARTIIPLHPGAEAAYREGGFL